MKKAILISALALCVAFATFATESGPSNTVGFYKNDPFLHGFTPFMLVFDYYQPGYIATTSIDTIIGTQPADGDEVWSQQRASLATYFGGFWYPPNYILYNTDAYWFNHPSYAPGDTIWITTAGEVHTAAINYGNIPAGFTAYGLPIAEDYLCSQLDLDGAGLSYLEVWDQISAGVYIYFSPTWYPDGTINPTHPIWTNNTSGSPSPNAWTFDPGDDGRPTTSVVTSPIRYAPVQSPSIDRVAPTQTTRPAPSKRSR